jgi:hypothetical protein
MTRKTTLVISCTALSLVAISTVVALTLRGDRVPVFTSQNPDEMKAYFASDAFRKLSPRDQLTAKKKAYGAYEQQQEQIFIDQAKMYAKLSPKEKIRFLDERIDEYVRAAQQKQQHMSRKGSGAASGSGAKGSNISTAKARAAKKTFSSEDIRAWSEKREPERRAAILELKEALVQRMEQRGIEMPGQGK